MINKNLFFDKVRKTDSCWHWIGAFRGTGYGCMKIAGKVIDSHRISWMIHFGEIPEKMWVLHKCDNRFCVNPEHLFLGDRSANMKDCANKGRLHFQKNKEEWTKKMQERFGIKVEDEDGNKYNSISEFCREKGLHRSGSVHERLRDGYKKKHNKAKIKKIKLFQTT